MMRTITDAPRANIGLSAERVLAPFLNLATVRVGLDPRPDELADILPGPAAARGRPLQGTHDDLKELGRLGRLVRAWLRGEVAESGLLAGLNSIFARCPVVYELSEGSLDIAPARDGDERKLLSLKLALVIADTIQAGEWHKLRQCLGCDCAFYDTSRNGMRVWCSMETCGNRAKVSRWRGNQSGTAKEQDSCACGRVCRCGKGKGGDLNSSAASGGD